MMNPSLYYFLIGISVLFCLEGAFNTGMTSFWLAFPFMVFLLFLTHKKGWASFVSSLVFIFICITFNLTIYKNPIIFPILKQGVRLEVVNDSFFRSYSDGSGSFVQVSEIYLNEPTKEQSETLQKFLKDDMTSSFRFSDSAVVTSSNTKTIYKLKKGQELPVLGIYNFGGIDSANQNYIVTKYGNLDENEIKKGNVRIVPDVSFQSRWSKHLGF